MLTLRDHQTPDLFDPWAYLGDKRRQLLEHSWAGVFRSYLLQHLPVAQLAPHFRHAFGRPGKDLYAALGALILQQLHDLTDAQTVEAVALHLGWQYALDIRSGDDAYLCERTLRNYRALLIEQQLDQVLFRSLTDRLLAVVGVDTRRQRLDSTAIRSAIRGLTRLGILVEAISKFLRQLRRCHPDLHQQVSADLMRRYVEREGPGCFASTKPSESRRRLPEAAADLHGLLVQFEPTPASALESFALLRRVFHEQCERVQTPGTETPIRIKEPQEIPCDNVLNPADPDASYNAHRGVGYLVQVMETFSPQEDGPAYPEPTDKPDLITHVAVGAMNTHDSVALGPALADVQARKIGPESLWADSHYGSTENVHKAAGQEVELVSPAMPPKGSKQEKLTLEHFELDEQGLIVRCPQGHVPVWGSVGMEKLQVSFAQATCGACPRQRDCCAAAGRRRESRYPYTPERVRQRARRLHDQTEAFRDQYRWRAGIEGTMARSKHQMGMGRLRVRGLKAVRYTAILRGLGLNIHRVAAYEASS
jgi:hypothetical protein